MISIEGDIDLHESRRGNGSYEMLVNNLQKINKKFRGKISSSTVFNYGQFTEDEVEKHKKSINVLITSVGTCLSESE